MPRERRGELLWQQLPPRALKQFCAQRLVLRARTIVWPKHVMVAGNNEFSAVQCSGETDGVLTLPERKVAEMQHSVVGTDDTIPAVDQLGVHLLDVFERAIAQLNDARVPEVRVARHEVHGRKVKNRLTVCHAKHASHMVSGARQPDLIYVKVDPQKANIVGSDDLGVPGFNSSLTAGHLERRQS